jgi:hypothetical protein
MKYCSQRTPPDTAANVIEYPTAVAITLPEDL